MGVPRSSIWRGRIIPLLMERGWGRGLGPRRTHHHLVGSILFFVKLVGGAGRGCLEGTQRAMGAMDDGVDDARVVILEVRVYQQCVNVGMEEVFGRCCE